MLCSICIATYKRPELLKKLLASLAEQKLPDNIELEIVVVDNDEMEIAREMVNQVGNSVNFALKYFTQPVKNISLTRNIAVAEAKGEYILFIDDDEIASPDWVANIYDTLIKYNVDAVFGRVISYFDPGTPEWIKNCFIYNRPAPQTGSNAVSTRTGNVIVRTTLLRSIEGPFEPAYGITGGSDTKLFGLLKKKKGAKYVNCYEAVTYEYVPPQRTKLKWLFIRAFRTGNNFVRRKIEFKKKHKFLTRINFLSIGIVFSLVSLFLTVLFVFNKTKMINWALKFVANWGKVAAVIGFYPAEY